METLEFLFPTVATDDDVNTAGQSPGPTDDESISHIDIATLSGERTTLPYNPDQTTVATDDDVNAAGQCPGPTNNESKAHIFITTLSGECTKLPYDPDQTIMEVKVIVEEELTTPYRKQCLFFNDTELKVSE